MELRRYSFPKAARALTVAAALAGASALATFPAQAQTILAATPPTAEQMPPALKAIPEKQCKYVAGELVEALKIKGKDFISDETRKSLYRFLVSNPNAKAIDCAGPREISWVTDKDFAFVMAIGDGASLAYSPVDFRKDYQFRPAEKASPRPSVGMARTPNS